MMRPLSQSCLECLTCFGMNIVFGSLCIPTLCWKAFDYVFLMCFALETYGSYVILKPKDEIRMQLCMGLFQYLWDANNQKENKKKFTKQNHNWLIQTVKLMNYQSNYLVSP